jgi:hypothetical protein
MEQGYFTSSKKIQGDNDLALLGQSIRSSKIK